MLALIYTCFISTVLCLIYGLVMFFKYTKSHVQKQLILAILGVIASAICLFLGFSLAVFIK